jgi:outer membrane protein OmpA-like peptidoglycan-associated protein
MKSTYIYVTGLLIFLFSPGDLFAQVLNGFNQSPSYITAYFRQENIIIEPGDSFFNVLIIENNGNQREELQIEVNAPMGWSVILEDTQTFLVDPGDSVLIPVRAAPSKGVEGEIGYSIIAAINTRAGETLANAYCFIKIPKQSDFRFRPITRVAYFDQQTGETEISFLLSNRGNVNELAYLSFQTTNNVALQNERENILNIDLVVNARSDTIINIPARLIQDQNIANGNLYRADLTLLTEDATYTTSFWFNLLSNQYEYKIPESEKILIAEIAAQNLLSEQSTNFAGGVRGNILLTRNRDISYIFYKYGSGPSNEILKYSRTRLAYNTQKINVAIGDITGLQLKYGGGKGAEFGYRVTENFRFTAMANENLFRPINNYGVVMEERYSGLNLGTRLSYSDNKVFNNYSYVAGARALFKLIPGHSLRADFGVSDVTYKSTGQSNFGYGMRLDYNGRFNKTNVRIREQFGSPDYYGQYSGRHNLMARISRPLRNNFELDLNVNDQKYKPVLETIQGIDASRFVDNRMINLLTRKYMDQGYIVYAGPVYERKSTNIYQFYNNTNPFTTQSAKLNMGFRINDGYGLTFNPSVVFGYTFVTDYSIPDSDLTTLNLNNKNFFNSHISLNFRKTFWGTYLNYFYGPYSVTQELSKFYNGISSNSIRIMPYLERFIYKDLVKLTSRLNFLHDFTFKTTRYNLSNQLDIYLANDFTISLLNNFSHQVTTDLLTEDNYKYSNNYVEVRVKKEFNWNQPRIKYYDLTINLFKDLNGNLRRDFNEPGIKDILVSISSIDPVSYNQYDINYESVGNMVSVRLLTGMEGTITYENLPRGLYKIELENIGRDQDKFFPDHNEFIINVADDKTVYVPYLERNRIFGRVVMNRSQLSNLGRIEVSNLRVTATDSRDRTTSTLTDANGYFEMYVPSVDSYIVSISNIFQEHFNLRQNNFRANLNGFKQFEVNFVFDEIRRQIEFTPSPSELEAEIRRVGRTNLAGNVRDASTLQGLRAQVEIINNETSATVERTYTERATGRYNTSFITYDNYSLIVTAPGYWMHSERLALDPFLTIQDVERDVLLENIVLGASFQLNNLIFTSGSSEIPNEALPELDRLIRQLRDNPSVRIRIVGHSDAAETLDDRNLSARRAEMVMRYMVQNGFSNIEFTGLEASQPIAPNDTEDNRRRNRRVEIIIVDK